MNIAVTGGAGYIGSKVVPLLLDKGHDVRVLDSLTGSAPNSLTGYIGDIEFIRGDVRDRDKVRTLIAGTDGVLHLAGITGASQTFGIREKTFKVNRGGTKNILRVSEQEGVEPLVFASSCNIYGSTDSHEVTEEGQPNPLNPYAESKLIAEKECLDSPVHTVLLRLSTNYGWSQGIRFNLVVNSFVFRALIDEPLTVYGDGTNWRPFIHVEDTCRSLIHALNWEDGVYNIGGDNLTINEVTEVVGDIVEESDVEYLDREQGPSYRADFSKSKNAGFSAKYSFEDGVSQLAEVLNG